MKKNWEILLSYLKDRLRYIYVYIIFIFIFGIVFYLYSLPLETVLYATLLCATIAIILSVYDFYKYYEKHKILMDVKHNITATLSNLPFPKTMEERDYQNLIITLYEDRVKLISKTDQQNTELIEYFTLWTHQIKTPISAANLLLQSDEINIKEDLFNQIFEMEQYVDMALQYLRIDSMSSDLRLEEYSLSDIIRKAVKCYAKVFIYKKIKLNLQEIDIKVITDEKWLLFVLKQIISNSLKYTNKGEISISIEGEKILVIKDTGIGIGEEDIPRVFERGFTGYNGRMNKKSTGLGLHLCKIILDKLSHKITITSKIGVGTIVKIDLSSSQLEIE